MDVVFQTEVSECGLACAAMLLSHHGHHVPLPELRSRYTSSRHGTSLRQIENILLDHGLRSRGLKAELDELGEVRTPFIAHWRMDHFVVVESVRKRHVIIVDPAMGRRRVGVDELDREYTGIALEAEQDVSEKEAIKRSEHGWGWQTP